MAVENRKITFLLLYALYFFSFYFVDWTVDKYNYEYMMGHIEDYDTDYIFNLLSLYSFRYGYTYDDIYHWHIILQSLFFALFTFKVFKKPWLPAIIFIALNYVNIANQIRYFMGFWLFLYGMTFYINKKSRVFYYLLGLVACLNHIGLVVLFACMPLYRIYEKITFKKYIILFIVLLFILPVITFIIPGFLQGFSKYLASERQSSLAGGVFLFFPILVQAVVIFANKYKIPNEIKSECNYKLLLSITVFSFIILPLALQVHIFSHRFVMPFIAIWLAFVYDYLKKLYSVSSIICLIFVLWLYFVPKIILGYSYYLDNIQVMFGLKNMLDV